MQFIFSLFSVQIFINWAHSLFHLYLVLPLNFIDILSVFHKYLLNFKYLLLDLLYFITHLCHILLSFQFTGEWIYFPICAWIMPTIIKAFIDVWLACQFIKISYKLFLLSDSN